MVLSNFLMEDIVKPTSRLELVKGPREPEYKKPFMVILIKQRLKMDLVHLLPFYRPS